MNECEVVNVFCLFIPMHILSVLLIASSCFLCDLFGRTPTLWFFVGVGNQWPCNRVVSALCVCDKKTRTNSEPFFDLNFDSDCTLIFIYFYEGCLDWNPLSRLFFSNGIDCL